ncbi:MAG: hypothetical protein ACXVDV_12455, partial [Bacteroidia bacterium]
KTRAYEYTKEIKLTKKYFFVPPVPNDFKAFRTVPNGSELSSNNPHTKIPTRSEQKKQVQLPKEESKNSEPISSPKKIKEFTGDDLLKKKFVTLNFESKFLDLIGRPEKKFTAVIWGLPKGGKSNLAIRFADYMQEYFGNVVYIASEEGESFTLQQKFKEIGGSRVTIVGIRNRGDIKAYLKEKDFDYVFIDSINNAGIDSEFLELIKTENPNKSFISIAQATKGGNFKGDQSLTHNCDFVIKVVDGVAFHEGRFGPVSEIKIFDEPLYKKNISGHANTKTRLITQEEINEFVTKAWNSRNLEKFLPKKDETKFSKAFIKMNFNFFKTKKD